MKKLSLIAFGLALCLTTVVNAATVTFTLDLSAAQGALGTYTLSARSSAGDNFGIAAYSAEITGDLLTGNHNSLRNAAASNAAEQEGPVGFTLLRSADVNAAPASKIIQFAGSQDIPGATPFIIYGLGQTPGDLTSKGIVTAGVKEGDPWVADMVIAKGTYNPQGVAPSFLSGSTLTLASIFTEAAGLTTVPATIETVVIPVPEPATFALAGLGLVGLVAARRRK